MPTEGIKIEKYFHKNLGLYFTDGFGTDGSVVKGLNRLTNVYRATNTHIHHSTVTLTVSAVWYLNNSLNAVNVWNCMQFLFTTMI